MPHTIRIHRVFTAPPEKVYRAFVDADAFCRWLPPFGFLGRMHEFDPKVGGGYRMSFTNFTTEESHSFSGRYLELVPGETIRYSNVFDDPNLPGEMHVTITLKAVECGTEFTAVQEGVPEVIPESGCYLGWQESMVQLANLVNPDIHQ